MLEEAAGRVLAESIRADRPAPPVDVSAMDGYAVRLEELLAGPLRVAGEAPIGRDVQRLEPGTALRIFTGGPLPAGADTVIRREDVEEAPEYIRIRVPPDSVKKGGNIRHRGENIDAGEVVVGPGRPLTAQVVAALAAFGVVRPTVHRRINVVALATGNELVAAQQDPAPTGLRDSNGPALAALLTPLAWARVTTGSPVPDDPERLREAVASRLPEADAVLLTGGVSIGDHDHVPGVLRSLGAEVIFHGLAMRPGGPVLGGLTPEGKLVMGLPGNPVAVLVTARRLALPALRHVAGIQGVQQVDGRLTLQPGVRPPHPLTRFVLVRRTGFDLGEVVASLGSGDLVAAARADGFVEIPPGVDGVGPFDFFGWGGA
jgi:molybdopterin molybdotransferase